MSSAGGRYVTSGMSDIGGTNSTAGMSSTSSTVGTSSVTGTSATSGGGTGGGGGGSFRGIWRQLAVVGGIVLFFLGGSRLLGFLRRRR
ncbi:hypothetical protein ACF06W_31860 [Streptomyces albus]|uniref:hypothetical protein n=1 Tax=Streptomyces albus TaxID=1888 RepID=UPI0036FED7BB